jgi:hypothetical protein
MVERSIQHRPLQSDLLSVDFRVSWMDKMDKLLEKISSYNIFNYFFPGAIFSVIAEHIKILYVPSKELAVQFAWYYFVGLVISRIGSLVIEPTAKATKLVKYANYSSYLKAAAADPKMEIMVEVANSFRTLAAAFALLLVASLCSYVASLLKLSALLQEGTVIVILAILFLLSFRKQAGFITKRVDHFNKNNP